MAEGRGVIIQAGLDVQIRSEKLRRDLQRIGRNDLGIDKTMISEIDRASTKIRQQFTDIIGRGMQAGLGKARVNDLVDKFKNINRELEEVSTKYQNAAEALATAMQGTDVAAKEAAKQAFEAARVEMNAADAKVMAAERATQLALRTEEKVIAQRERSMKELAEFSEKSWADIAKGFGSEAANSLNELKGSDLSGFTKAIGGALGHAGSLLRGRAAGVAAGAAEGSAQAAQAAQMAKLAMSLGVAAAALGVVALIVKVFVDAYKQAKEFNKALVEGAGAADMLWNTNMRGSKAITHQFGALRAASVDFFNNMKWGVLAEDQIKVLNAANEAGLTYKEMGTSFTHAANAAEGLISILDTANKYSRLLGMNSAEIATTMGNWSSDFGKNLKSIDDSLGGITAMAMQSGFSVKRFFTSISQATSGMALYNARLEEAAELLSRTGKILGEEEASKFLELMSKGFASEGILDRYKRVLIAGARDTKDIFSRSAKNMGADFVKSFMSGPNAIALETIIGSPLKGTTDQEKGTDLVARLSKMGAKDRAELVNKVSRLDANMARRLENLSKLSKGMTGHASDMAGALASLDQTGKMAMLLQNLGDKKLSEMTLAERALYETTSGIDAEQIEVLSRVQDRLVAEFDQIKKLRDDNRDISQEAQYAQYGFIKENGRIFSAAVDETGKVVKGQEIMSKTLGEYYQESHAASDINEKQMSLQEVLAQEMATNTRDIFDVLKNGIQLVLEKIFGVTEKIYEKMSGLTAAEKKAKDKLREEKDKQVELDRATVEDLSRQTSEAERQAQTAPVGSAERAEADEKVAKLKEQMAEAENTRKRHIAEGNAVDKIEGKGFVKNLYNTMETYANPVGTLIYGHTFRDKTLDEMQEEVQGPVPPGGGKGIAENFMDIFRWLDPTAHHGKKQSDQSEMPADAMISAADAMLIFNEEFGEFAKTDVTSQVKQKQRDDASLKMQKQDLKNRVPDMVKANKQTARELAAEQFAAAISPGVSGAAKERLVEDIIAGRAGTSADVIAAALKAGVAPETLLTLGRQAPPVRDFVYRGGSRGGVITPIDKADEFVGMKPDGAIAGALGRNVTININGGDMAKVYETVKRALNVSGLRA